MVNLAGSIMNGRLYEFPRLAKKEYTSLAYNKFKVKIHHRHYLKVNQIRRRLDGQCVAPCEI